MLHAQQIQQNRLTAVGSCPVTEVNAKRFLCRGRKREENRASLDGILEALNLNGSNPIAVMTQDISRSFLAGSNEKADRKKFDIYMEATLLAQSQENYQVRSAPAVCGMSAYLCLHAWPNTGTTLFTLAALPDHLQHWP